MEAVRFSETSVGFYTVSHSKRQYSSNLTEHLAFVGNIITKWSDYIILDRQPISNARLLLNKLLLHFVLGALACFPSELLRKLWILWTTGRTPWTGDQPCSKAATNTEQHKRRRNADRHPCLEWDSNSREYILSLRQRRCSGQFFEQTSSVN
jgi:hypothetical protein